MSRRALARVLALVVALSVCTVAAPTAAARADEIPRTPGHRLVSSYEGHRPRPVPRTGHASAAAPVPGTPPR
ncbi:hypothetical protein [Streptomyces sp. NPDC007988]|uniref:hypothetical protein n=1 Tax=Streptomyces sp. NPDC007988 TaxID=3364802 RepID=UPI0036E44762